MATILLETRINAPAEVCFDLSRNVDAHTASMQGSKEKAIAGVTTGLLNTGDTVTWQANHFFVKMNMTVKITEMQYPVYFIDEMIKGPFSKLWHRHSFLQQDGYTLMKDEFEFRAPLGILGKIAEWLFLENYMQQLLVQRNIALKKMAEEG